MNEYIERKKLEEAFDNADPDVCESDMDGHSDWGFGRENVRDVIRGVPAADVTPVVHSRWLRDGDFLICLHCEADMDEKNSLGGFNHKNYCPNCGAKMDGGIENASKEM